jgi:hypothetical protein
MIVPGSHAVKTWPSATRIEFLRTREEVLTASAAGEDAFGVDM